MPATRSALALLIGLAAVPAVARAAIVVDGVLDPEYGSPLAIQSTQTRRGGDNTLGQVTFADGSELDAAYGAISDGTLHLFFSGNLELMINGVEAGTIGEILEVFLDTGAGGQHVVSGIAPGTALGFSDGLTLDTGFAAGFAFDVAGSAIRVPPAFYAEWQPLPPPGGGTPTFLGWSEPGSAGALTGGANTPGVQMAVDNRNVAGVTAGCGAASGAGVTTGVELAIPLGSLGDPSGCVRVCALVYSPPLGAVTNQVLGPVPPGACLLGPPGALDLTAIAGEQFFSVCPATVPAHGATWGALKLRYR